MLSSCWALNVRLSIGLTTEMYHEAFDFGSAVYTIRSVIKNACSGILHRYQTHVLYSLKHSSSSGGRLLCTSHLLSVHTPLFHSGTLVKATLQGKVGRKRSCKEHLCCARQADVENSAESNACRERSLTSFSSTCPHASPPFKGTKNGLFLEGAVVQP